MNHHVECRTISALIEQLAKGPSRIAFVQFTKTSGKLSATWLMTYYERFMVSVHISNAGHFCRYTTTCTSQASFTFIPFSL